ncbi:hypothetical protein [Marixanthomonas spongiae]|uniref:Uncharacterized protein n=1 Tax=Marixanthomonas spongiae TaxID=2174845 RepID=A0A2U0I100_9FLAO|nr:hypothetical protein [Marixanthomonas spongiae]PVW14781.1 hypothetical protein DDV96_09710 [Marixanthomonas spongiae]
MKQKLLFIFSVFLSCILSYAQEVNDDGLLYHNGLLSLTYTKAIYKNDTIYNAHKEEQKVLKDGGAQELLKEGVKPYVNIKYVPISLIGNILSYERMQDDYWGGVIGISSAISVINVATQEPYSVLNIVEEASLLKAIKNDTYVTNSSGVDSTKLQQAKTFEDVLTLLNDQLQYPSTHFTLYSYAILDYNKTENKLALRLIRKKSYSHLPSFLQLGIKVTPNKEFAEKLKQNNNFYMGTFLKGRVTHQSFYKKF